MFTYSRLRLVALIGLLALIAAACGGDDNASADSECFADPGLDAISADGDFSGTEITLATHDSFALSECENNNSAKGTKIFFRFPI